MILRCENARARSIRFLVPAMFWLLWPACGLSIAGERLTLNFNSDWRFIKSDRPGASQADYQDANWALISAPHTFNDTDTFTHWSVPGHIGETNQWTGRTWYRKSFTVPESFRGRSVYIEFEAVRQIAEVYLNG